MVTVIRRVLFAGTELTAACTVLKLPLPSLATVIVSPEGGLGVGLTVGLAEGLADVVGEAEGLGPALSDTATSSKDADA